MFEFVRVEMLPRTCLLVAHVRIQRLPRKLLNFTADIPLAVCYDVR